MPRSFTEAEREALREAIVREGDARFMRHGMDRVRVEEITRAVGISKGSFYAFFASKEALYYEVFRRHEAGLQGEALRILGGPGPLTRERLRDFMRVSFRRVEADPILRGVFVKDAYKSLLRGVPAEDVDRHTQEDLTAFRPLVERWQAEGWVVGGPPEVIVSTIRALYVMALHRSDIGEEYYEETMQLLIDCLATGLTDTGRKRR